MFDFCTTKNSPVKKSLTTSMYFFQFAMNQHKAQFLRASIPHTSLLSCFHCTLQKIHMLIYQQQKKWNPSTQTFRGWKYLRDFFLWTWGTSELFECHSAWQNQAISKLISQTYRFSLFCLVYFKDFDPK